jgi:ribosomal protein L18E
MKRTGHQIRDSIFRNKGMSASLWEELAQTLGDPILQRFVVALEKFKKRGLPESLAILEDMKNLKSMVESTMTDNPDDIWNPSEEDRVRIAEKEAEIHARQEAHSNIFDRFPIDTVWKAQGVKLYAKFDLFQASKLIEVKDPEFPKQSTFTAYGWPGIDSTEMIPLLNVSEIVLWHQEPLETSTDMPLPTIRNINKDLMISDAMFMVWPYPHDATQVESIDDNLTLREGGTHWQLLVDGGEFLLNLCHLDTYDDNVEGPVSSRNHQYIYLERIPYGQYTKEQLDEIMQRETVDSLRDKERSESEMQSDDAIYQMLTFLNMKVADVEERKVERSVRKQIKRSNPDRDYSPINVVKLRRVMYKGSAVPTNIGTESTFEYKGRFWVRGHWTQQPYGKGRKLRRPQWIDPYIKGPDDKPMIEKAYVVAN